MMPELLDPHVLQYLDDLLPPRDPLLAELEAQARAERIPICGPHVGSALTLLIRLARPTRVLEVGTAIGYSAIWMGRALREYGGQLQTIELRLERIERAQANLSRAELSDVVEVLPGAALEVLPALKGTTYGLTFLDAVKADYPAYFEHALSLLATAASSSRTTRCSAGRSRPGFRRATGRPATAKGSAATTRWPSATPASTR